MAAERLVTRAVQRLGPAATLSATEQRLHVFHQRQAREAPWLPVPGGSRAPAPVPARLAITLVIHFAGGMVLAQSRLTSQGQLSLPAKVRERLGVGPGSTVEWSEEGGVIVVRKKGSATFSDVRRALGLGPGTPALTPEGVDAAIARHLKRKHARR